MNIEFLEETHTYICNGIVLPSVSKIMELISKEYYKEVDEDILHKACIRGSAIHLATENIDKGLDYEIADKWKDYILNYKKFKAIKKPTIIEIEQQLTNGIFCGTLDRIYEIDGIRYLADIKTSAKINDKLVSVQLGAYKILLNSQGITVDKYAVVHLTKTGYKFQEIEPNEHIFNCLLEIYKYNNA